MSSMPIPSSIPALKISIKPLPVPYRNLSFTLFSSLNPFITSFPHSFTSFKSISFQKIPSIPQSLPSSSSSSSTSSLQPIQELPPKLQEIIKLFQAIENPRAKYQQLLFYASNLPPLDDKYKSKDNKVEGCVSQVWVRAYLEEDKVFYQADSDSVMTKGLAALLVQALSGQTINDIVQVKPDFSILLGLQQTLTPSRNNGFLNMLRLMQRKAIFLGLEAVKEGSVTNSNGVVHDGTPEFVEEERKGEGINVGGSENLENGSITVIGVDDLSRDLDVRGGDGSLREEIDMSTGKNGGRRQRMKEVLERELKPIELEVEDVSYQHAGHAGVRGSDGETHFNLKIVSDEFQGKSMVKRHRMIYGFLQDELESGLHALSIDAKMPAEVQQGR